MLEERLPGPHLRANQSDDYLRLGASTTTANDHVDTTEGDSFAIGPSATGVFKNWPEMMKENEEIAYDPLVAYHNQSGERIAKPVSFQEAFLKKDLKDLKDSKDSAPQKMWRHSRPKFHNMLLKQLSRIGLEVEYGKEVVAYAESAADGKAMVILKHGSKHEADLVIAADGVRSASLDLVAGGPIPARSSGNAIFRAAYPVKYALADPMVAERFKLLEDGRSVIELWTGYFDSILTCRHVSNLEAGLARMPRFGAVRMR
jgi:hypothetical protein